MTIARLSFVALALVAPLALAACGSDDTVTERTTTTTTSSDVLAPADRSVTVERETVIDED